MDLNFLNIIILIRGVIQYLWQRKNIYVGLMHPCKQIELREDDEGGQKGKEKCAVYIGNIFLHTL